MGSMAMSWVQNAYVLAFGGFMLAGGRLGDIYGRKLTFCISIVLFCIGSLGAGLSQTAPLMIASRFVQGVGSAAMAPAALGLIVDYFQGQERVKVVAWYGSISGLGLCVGLVLGGAITSYSSWRWGFLVNIPITLIMLSYAAKWLHKGTKAEGHLDVSGTILSAIAIFAFVYAIEGAKNHWMWLVLFLLLYGALELAGNTSALEIALIGSFFVSLAFPVRSFGMLIIFVGVMLSGFQQFVGINVVLYYAPEIFKTMGAATDAALLQQIVVGAVNLSFTVLAIFTVDRFGRRPLMIIGALVMAVSMMVLGTTFYTHSVGIGSLVCMLVYTAGFAMSWGPVCWVLLAEIFPNTIRSTVMSIAVAGQWIANFLVSWTFPMLDKSQYLTDTFNHGMAYWVYGIMGILAALFIWKFVPETKGKTLEQMEQYWK